MKLEVCDVRLRDSEVLEYVGSWVDNEVSALGLGCMCLPPWFGKGAVGVRLVHHLFSRFNLKGLMYESFQECHHWFRKVLKQTTS